MCATPVCPRGDAIGPTARMCAAPPTSARAPSSEPSRTGCGNARAARRPESAPAGSPARRSMGCMPGCAYRVQQAGFFRHEPSHGVEGTNRYSDGKSTTAIIRCLERHSAREIYRVTTAPGAPARCSLDDHRISATPTTSHRTLATEWPTPGSSPAMIGAVPSCSPHRTTTTPNDHTSASADTRRSAVPATLRALLQGGCFTRRERTEGLATGHGR
jgi:hypothetical protein